MNFDSKLKKRLSELNIDYKFYIHNPEFTEKEAIEFWNSTGAQRCKNLFFRNHKGNKHYLVIMDFYSQLNIRDLELRLKQGKISFASEQRMEKYLGLKPGSVSLFGLINDNNNLVHVFLDKNLLKADTISFHPNINTSALIISQSDFQKFLEKSGNSYEFLDLY